jgi:hypothetical protein
VYTVRPHLERTLAHENIRKQGKFPNIAEISLSAENERVTLDGHFFSIWEKVGIWSNS